MPDYHQRKKKRFGQHFLHDRHVVEKMLHFLRLQPSDRVVEIGPGAGALTLPLLDILPSLDVIEVDRDVVAWWENDYPHLIHSGQLRIHAQDALHCNFAQLRGTGDKLRIVGNLPYNISTPLLFHCLRQQAHIHDMLFMLQKEVVERIVAKPGNSDYGRLSVMVQYHCAVQRVLSVAPGAFHPPPQVDSAVVYLKPWSEPPYLARDPEYFADMVAQAFSQRRKTLRNTLKGMMTAEQMANLGIDPQRRPETLSVEEFVLLANG